MKACEEFAALLDPYVDGELPLEETVRVQAHLEVCGGCRSYVDAALAIRAAFPTGEDAEVPDGFAEGVMAAIRADAAPQKRRKSPWAKLLLPLAACCAVVLLARTIPWNTPLEAAAPAGDAPAQDVALFAESSGESSQKTADAPMASDAAQEPHAPVDSAPIPAPEVRSPKDDNDSGLTAYDAGQAPESPPAPGLFSVSPAQNESAPAENEAQAKNAADAWVENDNVVFSYTVYLTPENAGDALNGFEGKPYSNASFPEEGVIGTGYALEQADFWRILSELGHPVDFAPNPDPTTELCCIVVTESPRAAG